LALYPQGHNAGFIRRRRVLLLRSYIRPMPSVIAFGSFAANKISLKPKCFNIT